MVMKVKVEEEKLKACLTCPICNNLFDRPTTISECLHTFCRKCIQDKITEDDLDTCPVCSADLGCAPLDKLRPDNSMQDLRLKLFPAKREIEDATGITAAPSLSSRKKEKSLSLLVASSPRVSLLKPNAATTRKSKLGQEKRHVPSDSDVLVLQKPGKTVEDVPGIQSSSRASSKSRAGRRRSKRSPEKNDVRLEPDMLIEEEPKRKADNGSEVRSSSKVHSDIAQDRGQNSAVVPPEREMQNKNTEEDYERFPRMSDLWKPLSCFTEAAGKSKTGKSNEQENIGISKLCNAREADVHIASAKELDGNSMRNSTPEQIIIEPVEPRNGHEDGKSGPIPNPDGDVAKASGDNPKENSDENGSSPPLLRPRGRRKLLSVRQKKKADVPKVLGSSQDATTVEANGKVEGRNIPVWFSLIASENQGTNAPLPQISSCYLRVKDSSLPVSYIKKYLVKKLSLASEAEVEISLRGQPLIPTQRLHSLQEWWVQTAPSLERRSASVGASAKDFIMVLSYSRKSQP